MFSNVEQQATPTSAARSGKPLQGQSVYVLNLGLNLVVPGTGTTVNALYNRLGTRIIEVATAFEVGDVFEQPRDIVDLSLTQPFLGGRYELRLAARDVLQQAQRFTQGEDVVRQNVRPRSVSLGISARL